MASTKSSSGSCCGSYRQQGSAMPTNVTVMMRAIDVVSLSRNKALLWTVPLGKGHLIATGLKLLAFLPVPFCESAAGPRSERNRVMNDILRLRPDAKR